MITQILNLFSAICFILSLRSLSKPSSATVGVKIGIVGMLLSILVTLTYIKYIDTLCYLLLVIFFGAICGVFLAKQISMTHVPQLVAGFHSFVGLAAVLVSYCVLVFPHVFFISDIGAAVMIEILLGVVIGAITFSGSIIAFAKLQGLLNITGALFKGQFICNIFLFIIDIILTLYFILFESNLLIFNIIVVISLLLGVLFVLPIGGADMPVVVSMLNSYSGWAAVGIGFTLNNILLIITGALIGASGAMLSDIMCKAMNRSLLSVIFGSFFSKERVIDTSKSISANVKISDTDEVAFLINQANSVIIVPGYGMAVSKAQHVIKEVVDILKTKNIQVRFAIHPVAGRMPGHMNVLLAEANIIYEDVFELEEINNDFSSTDIVLVIGANDIINPAAKSDTQSSIYGMPILNVGEARTIFIIKRSMAVGYAGIENKLFYQDNTFMLFGNCKSMVEDLIKSLNNFKG